MHQKSFCIRTPPGPAGELTALPRSLAGFVEVARYLTGGEREMKQEGGRAEG